MLKYSMTNKDTITLDLDDNKTLLIHFLNFECLYLTINDHTIPIELASDLSLKVNGMYFTLKKIIDDAENSFPDIVDEYNQGQADDLAMINELSCPRATGRV